MWIDHYVINMGVINFCAETETSLYNCVFELQKTALCIFLCLSICPSKDCQEDTLFSNKVARYTFLLDLYSSISIIFICVYN